jgi:glycosyltransferase involved in cell wall biosynthesis
VDSRAFDAAQPAADVDVDVDVDVAVVIPMFNSGRLAAQAIESVLAQTVPVSDIVVVDDGSTDDSAAFLKAKFERHAVPLRVFSTANGGAAAARNFGIQQCVASLVAFLDSDDLWLPHKLERQLAVLHAEAQIALVGTRTTMAATFADQHMDRLAPQVTISAKRLLFKNYFQTSTVLVRRSALHAVGVFPTGQRYAEEGDLFIRIAAHARSVLLNEVLVNYSGGKGGFGESGLSANLWGMERGELLNIRRAWKRGNCGAGLWFVATLFSLLKFLRRLIVRTLSRLWRFP